MTPSTTASNEKGSNESASTEAMAPVAAPTALDRLFAPQWAGGWELTRWIFAFAALFGHSRRVFWVEDVYAAQDMVFVSGLFRLSEYVRYTPTTAYLLWGIGMLGIAMIAYGGRAFRPGLLLWFVGAWGLLAEEALNVKAHDRLLAWMAIGMFLSPAGERGLVHKWRSPAARWYLLVVFAAIYASTGWMKVLLGTGWWTGDALAHHLVHQYHAGGRLAAWVSGQHWLTMPMSWWTLVFEISFPFLVMFRRTNPFVLVLGVGFHLGVLALMNVGAFSFVSLAAYPVLLDPEVGRRWWLRLQSEWTRFRART